MRILGIAPGPETSGVCIYQDGKVLMASGIVANPLLIATILGVNKVEEFRDIDKFAIERVTYYARPGGGGGVGASVFDTCLWSGRFIQAFKDATGGFKPCVLLTRPQVCRGLGLPNVNKARVNAVLIDRHGPGRSLAVGTKAKQGPLSGVHGHAWDALAVAYVAALAKEDE